MNTGKVAEFREDTVKSCYAAARCSCARAFCKAIVLPATVGTDLREAGGVNAACEPLRPA
jgi:hypothetical protein